ncbi:MAG TPA: NAD(P)-dependent oxidoreductase [Candidatus Ozemobacteraceae bacterium]
MKKAVVFGGSGFIGSYVADELSQRGYKVVVADIRPSKYLKPNQEFRHCDILDLPKVCEVIGTEETFVYNFAGIADLNEAIHKPLPTIQHNVVGNLNLLEACRGRSVKRFIYASSTYAFSRKGSFYGISKYTSEKLIEEYFIRYGTQFSIVRYGSLYGERADSHNFIYSILQRAIKEKKLVMAGDPEDVREYIHAQDAAKLSVDIIEDASFANQHIILTGFEKLKRIELFRMIREILGDQVHFETIQEAQIGHYGVTPYSFHPSCAKKLVANPFIDMGQGLVECLKVIAADLGLDPASSCDELREE